ncbi:MAG: type II toxin-antitoxin system YafQ family toxin [Defluviitaleaceae bacterium]|nr:type II toxin-antitoxin system YafQ family toxin [Defluviitaleaceae bacterium]
MTKYKVIPSAKFRKDRKRIKKRGYDLTLLENVVEKLANGKPLPEKHKDNQLKGNLSEFRECHITPDWLLVYRIKQDVLELWLMETGTHSDLF